MGKIKCCICDKEIDTCKAYRVWVRDMFHANRRIYYHEKCHEKCRKMVLDEEKKSWRALK